MGLRSLGKGDGLVRSYLDVAPHIAREVGEDASGNWWAPL
ncbi:hypothetical protein Lferr_2142 [Acidithiobacillus ferrooxidans ATCC 53993]|jgi:hypothetical protein|uniref:Uncharacterized protein n=1 Tax=Acidithiobacillus ferrooxidans (strain ATCC 23270 / DSM 14882 / CIP 104768 / NCIMB 8455) TaxID=243159 RepID=B7J746_ACIF2|nr:hypothetical protein Lferr_2142 [Acidithiobacillus ferrooxidans ATCC 53993]ACK78158.1 hypothetical protein AFE_2512 [Acidithiobacillus ferrooxidans ATCC 23270]EGQ60941.1 hypothetical protein GGI1_03531 [Acidithiobacillus sp. GGI-221]